MAHERVQNRVFIGGDEGMPFGRFCVSCTMMQMGDGGVSIPPFVRISMPVLSVSRGFKTSLETVRAGTYLRRFAS